MKCLLVSLNCSSISLTSLSNHICLFITLVPWAELSQFEDVCGWWKHSCLSIPHLLQVQNEVQKLPSLMMGGTVSFQRISLVFGYLQLTPAELYREKELKSGYPFFHFFLSFFFLNVMMPYVLLLSVFLKNIAMCCLISNMFKVKRKCSDIKKFQWVLWKLDSPCIKRTFELVPPHWKIT